MSFVALQRGGIYMRLVEPAWAEPLDGSYSLAAGGRWNPAGGFGVVYLVGSLTVARARVLFKLSGLPYGPEELAHDRAPDLVVTEIPEVEFVDLVTDDGLVAAGLAATYPRAEGGSIVRHDVCQPIGMSAWEAGWPGIACRSSVPGVATEDEELALFDRGISLSVLERSRFEDWFWGASAATK